VRRALIGWNSGVWIYLLNMGWMMSRADHRKVREVAERQDESAGRRAVHMVVGAMLSLYAIVVELAHMGKVTADQAALHYGFTALTVVGSWLLVGVLFCAALRPPVLLRRQAGRPAPLRFPDKELEPELLGLPVLLLHDLGRGPDLGRGHRLAPHAQAGARPLGAGLLLQPGDPRAVDQYRRQHHQLMT
jgi:hypothetical protein